MTEDDILSFVAASVPSVWALEMLFFLQREVPAGRTESELVYELRSSAGAISISAEHLQSAGLIIEEAGRLYYRPASVALDRFVTEAEALYVAKPTVVIKALATAPRDGLKIFADSFKLKE